jgi:hypothetical protein
MRQPFWLTNRIANLILRPLLRSPLAAILGRRLAVLRYTGHLSGTTHELIVHCATADHTIWTVPCHHERKTWWRNFRTPAESTWLAGKRLHGQAVVIDGHARRRSRPVLRAACSSSRARPRRHAQRCPRARHRRNRP